MGLNTILLFFTFSIITIIGLLNDESRKKTLSRSPEEWTADMVGLFIQGMIIPAFPFLIVPLLLIAFPTLGGKFEIHDLIQFVLAFIIVDYFYYWNHRIFHKRQLWSIHRLHHSSRYLDIFATSRNSLITSFLFVYVWSQILGMFLLKNSDAFMLGLGITFALDLWRHSGIKHNHMIYSALSWALIMPEQHVLHHSLTGRTKNYGANLCWWDKLHGTYSATIIQNQNLEKLSDKNIWRELFVPWKAGK